MMVNTESKYGLYAWVLSSNRPIGADSRRYLMHCIATVASATFSSSDMVRSSYVDASVDKSCPKTISRIMDGKFDYKMLQVPVRAGRKTDYRTTLARSRSLRIGYLESFPQSSMHGSHTKHMVNDNYSKPEKMDK